MSITNSNTSLLIFLAILPVMVILFYVYYKDDNKEPFKLLLRLFIAGTLSCGIVLFFSDLLSNLSIVFSPTTKKGFLGMIIYSFVGVALVEEITKWIMVYIFGYHSKEFDEPYDGLVYAVFVSLGFAFIENIIYVMVSNSIYTALVRALCAVPSHACDAIFMGYHLSIAKEYAIKNNKKEKNKHLLLSILMPTFLHGVYDYCLISGYRILVIIFLVFIAIMYYISISKLSNMSSQKNNINTKRHKYCKYCGTRIKKKKKCPNCKKYQSKKYEQPIIDDEII